MFTAELLVRPSGQRAHGDTVAAQQDIQNPSACSARHLAPPPRGQTANNRHQRPCKSMHFCVCLVQEGSGTDHPMLGSQLSRVLPAPPWAPANLLEVLPAEHPETLQGHSWWSCSVLTGGGQLTSAPRTSLHRGWGPLLAAGMCLEVTGLHLPWVPPPDLLLTLTWAPSSTSALLITTDAFNSLDSENYHKVLLYPRFCTPYMHQDG